MQVDQLKRMESRLLRIEKMLTEVLDKVPPPQKARMTEKEVMAEYNVSKNVLRRLRLGYKNNDGIEVPAVLFKWGHRHGKNFDYDREEVERVLRRTLI